MRTISALWSSSSIEDLYASAVWGRLQGPLFSHWKVYDLKSSKQDSIYRSTVNVNIFSTKNAKKIGVKKHRVAVWVGVERSRNQVFVPERNILFPYFKCRFRLSRKTKAGYPVFAQILGSFPAQPLSLGRNLFLDHWRLQGDCSDWTGDAKNNEIYYQYQGF